MTCEARPSPQSSLLAPSIVCSTAWRDANTSGSWDRPGQLSQQQSQSFTGSRRCDLDCGNTFVPPLPHHKWKYYWYMHSSCRIFCPWSLVQQKSALQIIRVGLACLGCSSTLSRSNSIKIAATCSHPSAECRDCSICQSLFLAAMNPCVTSNLCIIASVIPPTLHVQSPQAKNLSAKCSDSSVGRR